MHVELFGRKFKFQWEIVSKVKTQVLHKQVWPTTKHWLHGTAADHASLAACPSSSRCSLLNWKVSKTQNCCV